jgi:hypothetical protein
MICNNNKINNKLSYLRENFPFINDERSMKILFLLNNGFHIAFAIMLSEYDLNDRKIKILISKRQKELKSKTIDLLGQEKLDAINSFSIYKWECGGDKQLSRRLFLYLNNKKKGE